MAVVELQTLLDRSTKNMGSGMNSVVKESALEVIRRAYEKGIYVQLSAGFRSYAEQNALYAKGRTKPGSVVTNARGGYSNHNFGLAIDYFLTDKEGKIAHWDIRKDMNANQVADWIEVANIAKSLGFAWGGDWKSFPDYPHLEMTGGLSTAQLRAGSRPRLMSKVSNTVSGGTSKPASAATTSESIVDYLNSKKVDSSFANRKKIAAAHGISNYSGTAAQNTQLLELIKKNGVTPKKETAAKPSTSSYKGDSIVDYLNSIKVDSSLGNRKKLAAQYGIKNYTGTASQNTSLLNAMRSKNISKTKSSYKGNSLVDYLKSIKVDSSPANRKKLAAKYGIKKYKGTAAQNLQLLNKMR